MPYRGLVLNNRAAPARLAATVATFFGLAALAGWAFHIPALTSVIPGSVEMKTNTAIALVLCGIALLLLADRSSTALERTAQVCAMVACAIGMASLAEYLFDWQLGIDELIFKDSAGAYNLFRGRMSPFTAAAFIAIGYSLAAMPLKSLTKPRIAAAVIVVVTGFVTLLGYVWNASELITDRWLPPVAINTACCLVLLGGGVLLSPNRIATHLDTQRITLATIEVKILTGFLSVMSLLLLGGSCTYRTSVEFANSAEWVVHTQEVRTSLAQLYGSIVGAELAQRDYLFANDSGRWDGYEPLVGVVQSQMRDLELQIRDNPEQAHNFASLKTQVDLRLAEIAKAVVALRSFGFPAAKAVLRVARMTKNTTNVRLNIERMDAAEAQLLGRREAASINVRHTTLISLLITLTVASGLFVALFRGIHREMLARRDAERALRASDEYNRRIIESSPDCVSILTIDARISQMTLQGMSLLEISDFSSIAGTDWFDSWKGEELLAARQAVATARNGSAGRFQGQCPTTSGTPKWWDVIVMPIQDAGGRAERLLAVARDITEVKRSEAKLLETNHFLDSLIENLPVMVFVKDAATLSFVRQNRASEKLLGFSREEMIGKSDRDFFPADEAEFIMAKDREALANGRLVDIPEESIHTRLLGVRHLHTMKLPILDQQGNPRFLMGISVDITERKLAEHAIRELNASLQSNAEKLQATNKELESFSYSVSHDLRAPLRAIDGFALMLEEDQKDRLDEEGRRYLAVIRDNSQRMGALIDDLLAFSRLGRQPVAHLEVNVESLVHEVIEEALTAVQLSGQEQGAALPKIEVGPLPMAQGDRGLLRQVWANLISNAIKYSGKVARPLIQVSGQQVGAENHYSVRDNGVGFNMQYVEKLFGVFQRLHRADEFKGTGVGLAIVHRVVTRHGGRVWADGKVDQGAMFSFALPKGGRHG